MPPRLSLWMVSAKLTAPIIAPGISGHTLSPPGSLLTRAIKAEASSTCSAKGRILAPRFAQGIDQADAFRHVAAGHFLRLPDRLVERAHLDAVLRPAEDHLLA